MPACFLLFCVKNGFHWSNFYYASSSGGKSYAVHSSHKEEKQIPASYPSNNLMPQCSLELSSLFSTSYLNTVFRSYNTCLFHRSDYEEMPLQNGQAIRAKYKEESDSDWLTGFSADRLVHLEFSHFWSFPRWATSLGSYSLLSSESQLPGTSCFCFCLQG